MTRLIDADALNLDYEVDMADDWKTAHEMANIVKYAPTVDAVPVRHGKNVGTDYDEVDQFVCSECGIELQGWYRVERDEDDGEETYHEYRLRYCPQCGSRMDEE